MPHGSGPDDSGSLAVPTHAHTHLLDRHCLELQLFAITTVWNNEMLGSGLDNLTT